MTKNAHHILLALLLCTFAAGTALAQVVIPNVVGQDQATAESTLSSSSLLVSTIVRQHDNVVSAGDVISQYPAAGTTVPDGSGTGLALDNVHLVISLGPPKLVEGEYFWDDDPGVGQATPVSVTVGASVSPNLNVSTTALDPGIHTLFFRFKDANGQWGILQDRTIVVEPTQPQLTAAEYFWDADPGFGSATAISLTPGATFSSVVNVPTATPDPGLRHLFFRFQDVNGDWSILQDRTVVVEPTQPQLTAAEYFWDADPGFGLATAIAVADGPTFSSSIVIPTGALSLGLHHLFVRFQDTSLDWSLIDAHTVYIDLDGGTKEVSQIEYFVDTDPGFGAGTPFPLLVPGGSVVLDDVVPTGSLMEGFHTLYVRPKDDTNDWGMIRSMPFYVQAVDAVNVVAAEYFVDEDLGPGNNTPVAGLVPGGQVNLDLIDLVNTASLLPGFHTLHVRARQDVGGWGLHENRRFFLHPDAVPRVVQVTDVEYFVDHDPGVGNGQSWAAAGNQVVLNEVVSTLGLMPGFHTLHVRALQDDGAWGLLEERRFYLFDFAPDDVAQLERIEYFFDEDPGPDNGIEIPLNPGNPVNLTIDLPVPLDPGDHVLAVRALNQNGEWGLIESVLFNLEGQAGVVVVDPVEDLVLTVGSADFERDLVFPPPVFVDPDLDPLSFDAFSSDFSVVAASIDNTLLNVTPGLSGGATVFLEADDGNGGLTQTSFEVAVALWAMQLQVTDTAGGNATLAFGQAFTATAGLDPHLGEDEVPPLPPNTGFDAFFQVTGTNGTRTDLQSETLADITWKIQLFDDAAALPLSLAWDPADLPAAGRFFLQDMATNGDLLNVDMRTVASAQITDPLVDMLQIVSTENAVFSGTRWFEDGDAGQNVGEEQIIPFSPVTVIEGELTSELDADIYRIFIHDPANFTASTVGGANFNTMLSLFDSDGVGVRANDDAVDTIQSRLDASFDGTTTLPASLDHDPVGPIEPGFYLLMVSTPRDIRTAPANLFFIFTSTGVFNVQQGPLVNLPYAAIDAPNPLVPPGFGSYEISLTGTTPTIVGNQPPILANLENPELLFPAGNPPITLTSMLEVSDADDVNLVGATVEISANFVAGEDVLLFSNTPAIC